MKKILIFILILITLFIGGFIWWKNGLTAVNSANHKQIIFVVQKKEGVREIANKLNKEGLIRDPVVFFLLIKKLGLDGKIQAGDFRLSPEMTTKEIAENLTHGTIDEWVTIPEGKRVEEIAEILKTKIITYDNSWQEILTKNEGYLFPDTYLVPKDADLNLVLSLFKNNFESKFSQIQNINNTNLTKNQIVVLASIIEREAKFTNDRPLVASVLLNRMEINMPLQIDATIQYALGFQQDENNWWKKNLTNEDLKIKSPFNTYVNTGLPPTPISNPGFDALNAVVNPAKTNYLYYISDKAGHLIFAKTIQEHNANIKKYGL